MHMYIFVVLLVCLSSTETRREGGNRFSSRGPFLESPGNFTGPKSNIQIEK